MTVHVRSGDTKNELGAGQSYRPSWVDRLIATVNRLPGHWWYWYVGAAVLITLTRWLIDDGSTGLLSGSDGRLRQLLTGLLIPYCLGLMHYLDQQATASFERFLPVLEATEAERDSLRYRLTTTPRLPTVVAGLVGVVFALTMVVVARPLILELLAVPPTGTVTRFATGLYVASWGVLGTLFLHLLHQLRTINYIYTTHTRITLSNLTPLYAFSNFTLRAALGVGPICLAQLSVGSEILLSPMGLIIALVLGLVVIATFALPLISIHYPLADEKQRALGGATARRQKLLAELHRRVEQDELSGMDDLQKAVQMINEERNTLAALPTWPWSPDTLRNLVVTVLLPIAVWFIQQLLNPLLGR